MTLIQMFPELSGKTIWANMPEWAAQIVWKEIVIEQEIGYPMPNNSFYKMLSIKIIRQSLLTFAQK